VRYFSDGIALEDLRNSSICVKEGNSIRNTQSEEDLEKELLVFVNNVDPLFEPSKIIKKGKSVRYRKLYI
jgi:hypothetical protein